ncbi:MAG: hypothetical protein H8E25_06405 [Planctomycetes bacterium]|nr:hypothetical protein [Planctomycetota bacterium]
MRTLLAFSLFFILGLGYAASNSSPVAESGRLHVEVIDLKFANNYYELLSPDDDTFFVVERIDAVVHDRTSNFPSGFFDAKTSGGSLRFFMKTSGKKRYENALVSSEVVSNGAQGLAIPSGYTLVAHNPNGANKAIISYRVYYQ